MKAVGRQVRMSSETPNGDMKRRPSYPGELRAKHANMSAKIWVKVAMAIAYFLSVSVAAFILAIFYAFFWTSNAASGNSTSTNTSAAAVANSTERRAPRTALLPQPPEKTKVCALFF
uniref:Transmembrane protein INAFM2 n=1 Tax=Fundulus heteroclitus TaxID=8078 RepID=A0A3Q2QZ12_FUNHE